jgi:pimeloyl-ACP methyl ester carboxylesterase
VTDTQIHGKLALMSVLENINYTINGNPDGRRWVFVHGLMGFHNNWQRMTSQLGETECCLTYDQRGHGKSFKPPNGYTPEDYAKDLKDLTDALGWDKFILVGHSMGGRNVLVFASMYPEKVEKLVVEDIGPESNGSSSDYYEKLLGAVPTPFSSREQARDFFKNEFALRVQTKEPPNVLAGFLYANLEEKKAGVWDWKFSKPGILETVRVGRQKDRWSEVAALKMPTLWIRGELSKELSPESFQRILSSNPMIQGVEIAGAGHWIHSEKANEFLQALKNFVGGF